MFEVPERHREKNGPLRSTKQDGNNGLFHIRRNIKNKTTHFRCIASDGEGWEHVSISIVNLHDKDRCPIWEEMCFIKDIFWGQTDWVIQYHPAESDYISFHKYCLHLWRPINQKFPTPPSNLVGPKHVQFK